MEKIIVTIGRQYGSGGREIGKKLSERLGIFYYDKELLQLAAKESGLCSKLFEKADEKTSGNFLQALALGFSMNGTIYHPNDYFTDVTLFQVQSDVIRKLAKEKSCVIVGRCADYLLKDIPHCTHLFIHARLEERIRRVCREYSLSEKEASELIRKTDKTRASYYNYYTDKVWGAAESYHLCLDSSSLGIETAVDLLENFIRKRQ